MFNELLDIVDDRGQLTGERKARSDVHAQGLWHRVVHAYLYRARGGTIELLVHKRFAGADSDPNAWDTRFGGHCIAGQDYDETVLEELKEEAGIEVPLAKLTRGPVLKRHKGNNKEFTATYFLEYAGGAAALSFPDGEVTDARWMPIEEIERALKTEPAGWAPRATGFHEIKDFLRRAASKSA
ncbi:MAG: NUDIX domain-containing protein [Patescibacteria group bacterium]